MDSDGYGRRPDQGAVDRLIEDCRTLGPAGIERIAAAWDRRPSLYPEAEEAALALVKTTGRTSAWDELRSRLLGLTEQGVPLVSWRAEHGAVGHKAEAALLGAALALLIETELELGQRETLVRPMAAALPWLLSAPAGR